MDSQTEHAVTAQEPAWTEQVHTFDPDAGEYVSGELTATRLITMIPDSNSYECSCGKQLQTWEDAECHMKHPEKVTPSEATTDSW